MKKEQMVGTRLPEKLVQYLQRMEDAEQPVRSTTVRKLLSRAVRDWKLEHYTKLYGEGEMTLARAARDAGVSMWEMMNYAGQRTIPAQCHLEGFQRDFKTVHEHLASC